MRWRSPAVRCAAAVAIILALGATSTVSVAWALAVALPHRDLSRRFNIVAIETSTGRRMVGIHEVKRPGMLRRSWQQGPWPAPAWYQQLTQSAPVAWTRTVYQDRSWGRLPGAISSSERNDELPSGMEDARGWPFLCLWCGLDAAAIEGAAAGDPAWGGIPVGSSGKAAQFRVLPFWPIIPGLLANIAIYSGAWCTLLLGAWIGRRVARVRSGRCPRCGYLDAPNSCPECGRGRSPETPRRGTENPSAT
jgi:hypothetical protein